MNEIVNKFLLAGDKFMPEMHLKQPNFSYGACGVFAKNKERIEKFMQTGNTNYIHKNDLGKACFQHNIAYGKFKDLAKRTQSDKVLTDKAFQIAEKKQNMMDIKGDYLRWFASFLIKDLWSLIKKDLHKPIVRKCVKRNIYSSIKDNI